MSDIDPAERLLNLIIALSHTRVRMLRSEIRASVAGYEPEDSSLSPEDAKRRDTAFERMFERDKDDLRRMGVPLRTITDAAHGDAIGYKIDATDAAMPPIDLTPAELAVVAVAGEYWQDAALGSHARQAVTKVASGASHHPREPLPFAARSTASHDATATLIDAIHDRQAVSFEYSSATSGTSVRTIEPWRLVLRGGTEYIVGFDRDRDAARTFRISRVHGKVKHVGSPGAFDIPRELPAEMWDDAGNPGVATVAVRAEAGHALRARGTFVRADGDWDVLSVPYRYPDVLRDQVLGLAGAARVLEPEFVASAVMEHARLAVEATDG